MLEKATNELVEKLDKMVNTMVRDSISASTLQYMGVQEFEVIKDALNCWEKFSEVMVKQAQVLDDLTQKMDELLERSQRA